MATGGRSRDGAAGGGAAPACVRRARGPGGRDSELSPAGSRRGEGIWSGAGWTGDSGGRRIPRRQRGRELEGDRKLARALRGVG